MAPGPSPVEKSAFEFTTTNHQIGVIHLKDITGSELKIAGRLMRRAKYLSVTLAVLTGISGVPETISAESIPEPGLILYGIVRSTVGGQDIRVTSGTLTWAFKPSDGSGVVSVSTLLTNLNDQFSFIVQVPCESPVGNLSPSVGVLRIQNPPISYNRTTVTLDGKPLTLKDPIQANFILSGKARGLVERIDLVMPMAIETYEAWAQRILGRIGNENEDPDGDEMTNFKEFKAGTDPKDKSSLFEFIEVRPVANNAGARISWTSVPGKFYSILRSRTLSLNPTDYKEIKSQIPATAPVNVYVDTEAAGAGVFFYRLKIDE